MDVAQKNFRELIAEKGLALMDLARLLAAPWQTFRRDVAFKGRATPQEVERIAQILGVSKEDVQAALAETVRRPGERDARGRKKIVGGAG